MVLCSSRTGQAALQKLPSAVPDRVFTSNVDIANFPLPKSAVHSEASTSSRRIGPDDGISVWKINKVSDG